MTTQRTTKKKKNKDFKIWMLAAFLMFIIIDFIMQAMSTSTNKVVTYWNSAFHPVGDSDGYPTTTVGKVLKFLPFAAMSAVLFVVSGFVAIPIITYCLVAVGLIYIYKGLSAIGLFKKKVASTTSQTD